MLQSEARTTELCLVVWLEGAREVRRAFDGAPISFFLFPHPRTMDPSSYALQAARQAQGFGYGPTYHFPNPGSVGIKLEATPASVCCRLSALP